MDCNDLYYKLLQQIHNVSRETLFLFISKLDIIPINISESMYLKHRHTF